MIPDNIKFLLTGIEDFSKLSLIDVVHLDVSKLRGIGPTYSAILKEKGIKRIKDLPDVDKKKDLGITRKLTTKWSIASKIIINRAEGVEQHGKIIFTGLSEAGKTSIIDRLKAIYRSPAPTLGAKPEVLKLAGIPLRVTDMGGQKTFRDAYLEKPELYFANAKIVFYVVDIQDEDNYQTSIDYLIRILSIYRYLNEAPELSILIHKYDQDKAYILKHKAPILVEKIKEGIKHFNELNYDIHYTSIFTPSSIYVSMAKGLTRIFPVFSLINSLLEEFAVANDFDGLALLDDKGLLIGLYISEKQHSMVLSHVYSAYHQVTEDSIQSFTSLLLKKDIMSPEGSLIVQKVYLPRSEGYTIFWRSGPSKSANINDMIIRDLTSALNPWLYNLLQAEP